MKINVIAAHIYAQREENYEIQGKRVYQHASKMLDFTDKTIVQKYIFPSATFS